MEFCGFVAASPLTVSSTSLASVNRCTTRRSVGRVGGVRMMADDKKDGKGGMNPLNALGALGGMGNIMDAMKKAQAFTSSAKDLQSELADTEIETTVREGAVKVVLSAQQKPISVTVSEELVAQGHEEVSAAVTEAFITAHEKSSSYMKEKMGNLTKDFGLPAPPTTQ